MLLVITNYKPGLHAFSDNGLQLVTMGYSWWQRVTDQFELKSIELKVYLIEVKRIWQILFSKHLHSVYAVSPFILHTTLLISDSFCCCAATPTRHDTTRHGTQDHLTRHDTENHVTWHGTTWQDTQDHLTRHAMTRKAMWHDTTRRREAREPLDTTWHGSSLNIWRCDICCCARCSTQSYAT